MARREQPRERLPDRAVACKLLVPLTRDLAALLPPAAERAGISVSAYVRRALHTQLREDAAVR